MEDLKIIISFNLNRYLIDKNISIADLSRKTRISTARLCNFLNQKDTPSARNLVKISDGTQLSINQLLGIDIISATELPNEYNFFKNLNYLLYINNLGIYEFSTKADLYNSNYYTWKKGSLPKPYILKKLSLFFKVSADYLLGRRNR